MIHLLIISILNVKLLRYGTHMKIQANDHSEIVLCTPYL